MIRGPRRLPKLEAHVNAIAEINVLHTTLPPLGGKNPQTALYYSRKGWANRLEMWVVKYPAVSGIFLRCSRGSPAKIALLVTSLLKRLPKGLGDFRGKSWGSSQPFSSDAQIISIPLQMFINSSRCHTLGWKCQEKGKQLWWEREALGNSLTARLGLNRLPIFLACLCWTRVPGGGFRFPFCQEISLEIKRRRLLRMSKNVLFLPATHREGAKSCPETVPKAKTFL